jgi:hypothetical protein
MVRKYFIKDSDILSHVIRQIGDGRVRAVPVVTRSWMEGLDFEPPWRRVFLPPPIRSRDPIQPPVCWLTRL